jgi:predicted acetyltransferase
MPSSTGLEVRPVTPEELEAFTRVDLAAFGESTMNADRFQLEWTRRELDRTLAAFDGDDIVASGRAMSFELTAPGSALIPAAAVTWIAVLPTHRRRGILTALMHRQLADATERGEPLAMLMASEGTIYRRFGYGIATNFMSVSIDRKHSTLLISRPDSGRVRLVDQDAARVLLPEIFDRARREQVGAVQRVDAWWPDQYFWPEPTDRGAHFYAVHENGDGELDGYVAYRVESKWDYVTKSILHVDEVISLTSDAHDALWRFVFEVDLIETIRAEHIPLDDPLRWQLAESRRLQVTRVSDWLWVRLLDLAAALEARTYMSEGSIVFQVVDEFRPKQQAAGRFELQAGPEGASVRRTKKGADLALDVPELGAAYLGGVRFSTLARAGLLVEQTAGALARADAMFATDPLPFAHTWF